MAQGLTTLDGLTLGVLNNSKPNSLALQQHLATLLGAERRLASVVVKQKPTAANVARGSPLVVARRRQD